MIINQTSRELPAPSHPKLKAPFTLYVAEKHGTALGFLYRSWRRFWAYWAFFQTARFHGSSWMAWLCPGSSGHRLLVEEANKLTLGQQQNSSPINKYKGFWDHRSLLANWRLSYYSRCDPWIVRTNLQNFPYPQLGYAQAWWDSQITDSCLRTSNQVYACRPNLRD